MVDKELSMSNTFVAKRRAIEALRAGVPNRDVARELPPYQSDITEAFDHVLAESRSGIQSETSSHGLILKGDFGTGKSHWLEYFRHLALDAHFIVSTLVLNKETPLCDLDKLYRACVESAEAHDKIGPALTEISQTYHSDRAPHYDELFNWVTQTSGLDPRCAATLQLFTKTNDADIRQQIVNDWTGYPMLVPDIRKALRAAGLTGVRVGAQIKGQELQRFEFMARFFRSAGYSGWVILLDEGEITSFYTARQRAKAYANLAKLCGYDKAINGMATVLTITNDYVGHVLFGRKNDREMIRARLNGTGDAGLIPLAEKGMGRIIKDDNLIHPCSEEQVEVIYERVRSLYSAAYYPWVAPDLDNRIEVLMHEGLRRYIRTWIIQWDIRRLYDEKVDVVTETLDITYDKEDADMQVSTGGEDEENLPNDDLDIRLDEDDEPTITL